MVDKQEVITGIQNLVQNQYGGDYQKAFDNYATNGAIDTDAMEQVLSDAGIGSRLTRWVIAGQVISQVDTNGDGSVSWAEFESVLKS